jgi:lysozyme family protein
MAKVNVAPLIIANEKRWRAMRINPKSIRTIDSVAKKLVAPAAKARYQSLEKQTGVPWFIIAVIHQREASQRWDRNIANGQPFKQKTTIVPKGRGPFPSFEAAALDALKNCAPYAARWRNWTPGGALTLKEMYNGLGYYSGPRSKGKRYPSMPSPYIWAGTDQAVRGKYVKDGVFDPVVWDQQLGCAALISRMAELDEDVKFSGESKKVETGTAGTAGAGTAIEAARQGAESGLTPTKIAIMVGCVIAAAVATYFIVRWVRRNKPKAGIDVHREAAVAPPVADDPRGK